MEFLTTLLGMILGLMRCLFVAIFVPFSARPKEAQSKKSYLNYQEWRSAQVKLDQYYRIDQWAQDDRHAGYDYKVLHGLVADLKRAREIGDELRLGSLLRAHSRNICRVLTPSLYRKSQIRTKNLIHEYLEEVHRCIRYIASLEPFPDAFHAISPQQKKQLMSDLRATLGRTTLVLQGGALMSMCHLGMIKILYEQGILPRIITGIGTGSLVAALVCTTVDDDLPRIFDGSGINLDAFDRHKSETLKEEPTSPFGMELLATLLRRYKRFRKDRHIFDIGVLAECVNENIGDITFEEAFHKTGRSLNITIAMSEVRGTPQLLNKVTAPHVLVWSAVIASIATSKKLYAPVNLLCKSETGIITTYNAPDFSDIRYRRETSVHPEPPLQRIGEIYNVNHFIVSQTRPYIALFVRIQRLADCNGITGFVVYKIFRELFHWLDTLYFLNFLPTFLMRIMMDEEAPSSAARSKISISPELHIRDAFGFLDLPTHAKLGEGSIRGEKGAWPYICELKCRCDIELAIESAYEELERRVPPPRQPDWVS